MIQLTDETFGVETINRSYEHPVFVQFWAPWCGPCHTFRDTLTRVFEQEKYSVRFTGVDVDQYTDIALQQKVMGVPHTKIYINGSVIDEFSDPISEHEINLFMSNALSLPHILKYKFWSGKVNEKMISELENGTHTSLRRDTYYLTLARYYFFIDPAKSKDYLDKISDHSEQFEIKLFMDGLYSLLDREYSPDHVSKKLWSAGNALKKKNFESTYQFLIQANKIYSGGDSEFPRMALMGLRAFLGPQHDLNKKYKIQFDQVI